MISFPWIVSKYGFWVNVPADSSKSAVNKANIYENISICPQTDIQANLLELELKR